MKKDFFGEMNFEVTKRLDKPFAILIFGLPGSGKTYISQRLSKELGTYLLSGDYVRRYYFGLLEDKQAAKRITDEINMERVAIFVANSTPFTFDGNDCDRQLYRSLMLFAEKYGFSLIKIKVNSLDDQNIDRLKSITYSPYNEDLSIIGDSGIYGISCDESQYKKRKEKCYIMSDEHADYIINNMGTIEDLDSQLLEVIESIRKNNIKK